MKWRLLIPVSLLLTIVFMAACSKSGTTTDNSNGAGDHTYSPDDTIPPVLSITTPVVNDVFTSGNSINVTGRIEDDLGLYRGTIRITDDGSGAVLKDQPYEIHGIKAYNFSLSYLTSVTSVSNYTVTVSFEDHGLNATTKSVKVKVNP
jgi:Bacterial Ig domain